MEPVSIFKSVVELEVFKVNDDKRSDDCTLCTMENIGLDADLHWPVGSVEYSVYWTAMPPRGRGIAMDVCEPCAKHIMNVGDE